MKVKYKGTMIRNFTHTYKFIVFVLVALICLSEGIKCDRLDGRVVRFGFIGKTAANV